jgi:glycosyltransferase involved in cell wall biosynthesis
LPYIKLKPAELAVDSTKSRSIPIETARSEKNADILFLVRKNPGSIGGIQRLTSSVIRDVSSIYGTDILSWNGPEWGAPIAFPKFYYKSLRHSASVIHCDDAVTSLLGTRIKNRSGKQVIATVHGLDVILPIDWYQRRLKLGLGQLDKIICLSQATARQAQLRGVEPHRIEIIPAAVEPVQTRLERDNELYSMLEMELGIDLRHKRILLSMGRPVARKGFDFFAERVFPYLPEDYIYIIAGPKPATPSWIRFIRPLIGSNLYRNLLLASGAITIHDRLVNLASHRRIVYVNGVSEGLRERLFAAADLFIMPNRSVAGDMEGFGLVALEAAARGIPVVATGIEGITDAVIDGKNGFWVSEGDWAAMSGIIMALLNDPLHLEEIGHRAAEFTHKVFAPEIILGKYKKLYQTLLGKADFSRTAFSLFEKERMRKW